MAFRNVDTVWNTFEMLAKAGNDTLESILKHGEMPKPEELVGNEYNGYSTWWVTKPLSMAKFIKGFIRLDPHLFIGQNTENVGVYNVKAESNELDGSWIAKRGDDGKRLHFGYGDVYPAEEDRYDCLYKNSLLINYGLNPANAKHPVRNFRDYIVCGVGDDSSVLVGKSYTVFGPSILPFQFEKLGSIDSYIAMGALRSMPNYFVLIRNGKSDNIMNKYFSYYTQSSRMVKK